MKSEVANAHFGCDDVLMTKISKILKSPKNARNRLEMVCIDPLHHPTKFQVDWLKFRVFLDNPTNLEQEENENRTDLVNFAHCNRTG